MMSRNWRFGGAVFILLAMIFIAAAHAEDEAAGKATVVVALEWAKGTKQTPVDLVLMKKEYDSWVVAKKVTAEKSAKFEGLAEGEYRVGTAESEVAAKKVFGQGSFSVGKTDVNKVAKIDLLPTEVVEIEVDAKVDGKPIERGGVNFNRTDGIGGGAEYFFKPVKIKLAADAKYTITFDFNSERLGKKSMEIVPREWAGKQILFETTTPAPALAVKWTVAEKDRELAGKDRRPLLSYLIWRAEENGNWRAPYPRYVTPRREYEILPEAGAAMEARIDKLTTFEWGDGKYKLELIAAPSDSFPRAALASNEILDVEIKDGKISGVKEFELSTRRVATVSLKVEDPNGKPVANAWTGFGLPDGNQKDSGKTEENGVWNIRGSFLAGEYQLSVNANVNGWPGIRKRVTLKPGANEVLISYKEMVTVEVEIAGGADYAWRHMKMRLDSSSSFELDNKTKRFTFHAMPDEFPMLVVAGNRTKMTGVTLKEPPKEVVKLALPENKSVDVKLAMEVAEELKKEDVAFDRVYFVSPGTLVPAAVFGTGRQVGEMGADGVMRVHMEADAHLAEGAYDSIAVMRAKAGVRYVRMKDWKVKEGERLAIRVGVEEMKKGTELPAEK